MTETIVKTERGWAGHFICARNCLFRRNTLLEYGNIRIVISTVGNMLAPSIEKLKKGFIGDECLDFDEIGLNRNFETMVFHAKKDGVYWDADVGREIPFDSQWSIADRNFESDLAANNMHEEVVKEIYNKLAKGEQFERRET